MALAVTLGVLGSPARAQDSDLAAELQCLRYAQGYERNLSIPVGLLTAISYTEAGRPVGGKTVAWPWTINVNGQGRYFETKEDAVRETRKLRDEGEQSIDVGCMQVSLRYHPNAFRSLDDAFDPAINVAYGAKYLKTLHEQQGSWPKAIERYHSSDDLRRSEYREKVMAFWSNDARMMVLDAVMAEDTDTPYHRALRDFAAGRYAEALDKYQRIVETAPKDRIGLLGLAMSFEKLSRPQDAADAYGRYLVAEPGNESIASRVLQDALALPPAQAHARIEALVEAGVRRADYFSALAELTGPTGDNEKAYQYAASAASQSPNVAMYKLNAAVLADRLKRKAEAAGLYEEFLRLFEVNPVVLEVSIAAVRERMRFLQSGL